MKKIIAALCGFALALTALGQSVNGTQIRRKSDGSVNSDTNNAVKITSYRSASAPTSPTAGDIWCDLNFTPCIFRVYDGTFWQQANTFIPATTQADLSSFPGSPANGQWFWDKSHNVGWVYDSTATNWYRMDGSGITGNTGAVVDHFTGTPITAPGSGMTIADGGAGGTATAGSYSCVVTFANSTGGETTVSPATSNATITASHAITFSSVPTGGAGTSSRRLYCSLAGSTAGPWLWWGTINDNSTTSATINGVSNANMKLSAPNRNYSAALNGRWTVANNTTATTSGGCGATGHSMVCKISNQLSLSKLTTADNTVNASFDITTWKSGNFTITYRIVAMESNFGNLGVNGATGFFSANGAPGFGGLSVGTSWTGGPKEFLVYGGNVVAPLNQANVFVPGVGTRTSVGGTLANLSSINGAFRRIYQFPFWVKIVKYANNYMAYLSIDGWTWNPVRTSSNAVNPADSALSIEGATPPVYDTFFIDMGTNGVAGIDLDIEIDELSLVVN